MWLLLALACCATAQHTSPSAAAGCRMNEGRACTVAEIEAPHVDPELHGFAPPISSQQLSSAVVSHPQLENITWTFLNPGVIVYDGTVHVFSRCLSNHWQQQQQQQQQQTRMCPADSLTSVVPCPPLPNHRIVFVCHWTVNALFIPSSHVTVAPYPLSLDALSQTWRGEHMPTSMRGGPVHLINMGCADPRVFVWDGTVHVACNAYREAEMSH